MVTGLSELLPGLKVTMIDYISANSENIHHHFAIVGDVNNSALNARDFPQFCHCGGCVKNTHKNM